MRVVSHVLVRAPLLPVSALEDAERALAAHPLGHAALRLASPTLVAHADERAARTRRRYARRAAFRPTPHGLLAGVAVVRTGDASRLSLGAPSVTLAPSWRRLADLGRALLDTDAGWRAARLRCAPSLVEHDGRAAWLVLGDEGTRRAELAVDAELGRVLDAARAWIAAPALAARLRGIEDARALLVQLVDDGLLHHDLEPPLVGPPPAAWARDRLAALAPVDALAQLDARDRPIEARLDEAERLLAALPGAGARPLQATLVHAPGGRAEIDAAALARAAALAPLLFALADALSPPAAEAALVPGLADALAAASHLIGEGLLDVAALELGAYGVALGDARPALAPGAAIVSRLAGLVVEAARTGASEIALDAEALAVELPAHAPPPTFELQLTPDGTDGGGEGWLLGVHAPAGASWGRFAAALGDVLTPALAELRAAEAAIDGDALRLDVAYAPSREAADLCTTPVLRDAALAISSWPAEGAVVPAQCAIADDPGGPAHGGFVAGGHALEIAPLHRVRSTTAPPSVHRALLADRLMRQHAPWALAWGPLNQLPWLPRVRLDGFVIAPQSWALPPVLDEPAIASWRRSARPPRLVQVGAEDALLPIDLDDAEDRATLAALPPAERARAWEIWPPLGRELDEGGRRVELVCAVVGRPDGRATRLGALGRCPPPGEARAPGWRTIKLFAPTAVHDELLDALATFVQRRDVLGWFFLPYVDPPGDRPHLRVRLRARDDRAAARLAGAFAERIERRVPALVAIEIGAYHREHARFGAAMEPVERAFEADAALAVALRTASERALPPEVELALGLDALAAGLGLPVAARAASAAAALSAHAVDVDEQRARLAPAYRAVQRELLALLDDPPPLFAAHRERVREAKLGRARGAALLPALAHLAAVRRCGPDRDAEVLGLYLWSRALESRLARRR